ncbi:MAG: hypothetical protein ABR860_00120 [Terracidiphilus sp.]
MKASSQKEEAFVYGSGSGRGLSVIVGAAEVVAAVGADQLAAVAGKAMTAGGADLAVVIDTGIDGGVGGLRVSRVNAGVGAGEGRVRAGRGGAGHTTL